MQLPNDWATLLGQTAKGKDWDSLAAFVAAERAKAQVLPEPGEVFAALEATPVAQVRVVLLGQDPYPTPGHAHGLCFSVREGVKPPASLANMYRELHEDLGVPIPQTGNLMPWARRGMLLLNTVLTVRAHEANSHQRKGWEKVTDAIIRELSARPTPLVFALWGGAAKKKEKLIDAAKHAVVANAHPSPLSIKHWRGSKPFSRIDEALERLGHAPFEWALDG